MAYTTIDDPEAHFQTVLYTGNTTARDITFTGTNDMQPDLVWIKERSAVEGHKIFDAVRGATKLVQSSSANAEQTNATSLTAFNSDGFSLGTDSGDIVNEDGITHVAWCWKAGNGTATNTTGDKDSTVSVNTAAGISIVKWENDTSDAISIGHSLGAIPDAVIVKELGDATNWHSRWKGFAANDYISLNSTEAKGASTAVFATLPTSALFYTGTAAYHINANLIAYCFTSIQGFSKIGSFIGNGNADGPMVYTGFSPAYVVVKNSGGSEAWNVWNNKTPGYNVANKNLQPNSTAAEQTSSAGVKEIDFLSNGFKIRGSNTELNQSGNTHIYMAFAEAPLVNSKGVPCTAR